MKFLIVGLGSMGKRRIRCLQALGYKEVRGVDRREERRREAQEKYAVATYADIDAALREFAPEALIISVPPDVHHEYIKIAVQKGLHFFVEASVVDTDMDKIIGDLAAAKIVAAPSATMLFHPAIQKVVEIVKSGELGKLSNITYHSGQYLPDWHTYEAVSDYYVSRRATGGAREIVPFELSWMTQLLGFPRRVGGNFRKTIDIKGAEAIDDTYNCLLDYGDFLVSLTVDVVSRYATRRLLINGDKKQLYWSWDEGFIKVYDPAADKWTQLPYEMKTAATGYNANIGENMYIEEIRAFIAAVAGKQAFVNSMANDHKVLKLLYAIEEADKSSRFVELGR